MEKIWRSSSRRQPSSPSYCLFSPPRCCSSSSLFCTCHNDHRSPLFHRTWSIDVRVTLRHDPRFYSVFFHSFLIEITIRSNILHFCNSIHLKNEGRSSLAFPISTDDIDWNDTTPHHWSVEHRMSSLLLSSIKDEQLEENTVPIRMNDILFLCLVSFRLNSTREETSERKTEKHRTRDSLERCDNTD